MWNPSILFGVWTSSCYTLLTSNYVYQIQAETLAPRHAQYIANNRIGCYPRLYLSVQ